MKLWSRWVEATSRTEDATSFALFRIGMGLGVLYTVGSVVVNGLVPVLWIDEAFGGMRDLFRGPWLVAWLGGPTPGVVWPLVIGSLIGGVLLTIGLGGRLMTLVTLTLTVNVLDLNGHAGGSYDELLSNGLWLCVLGGGEGTLSVSAWLAHRRWWPSAQMLAFPRWLVGWQLVLMYGATGLQKVSAYWVPGGEASALYYILQQPSWHRADMSWLAYVFPLTQLSTTISWLWEVSAPVWLLAVWWASWPAERAGAIVRTANRIGLRWIYLGLGLAVHVGIFLTMEVGPFSFLSLMFYTAMVYPHEWRWLGARLGLSGGAQGAP